MINRDLLEILACPRCKGKLSSTAGAEGLNCSSCQVTYPIQNDVPSLVPEASRSLSSETDETRVFMDPGPASGKVQFNIVEGKNKGQVVALEKGCCRALGRSINDTESTRVFSVDSNVGLDDLSKKLVMGYVAKQFKSGNTAPSGSGESLGSFQRKGDVPLKDGSVSRLHAMLFYGVDGVGILDLVSKNGTFVNGSEVESKLLQKGDIVSVGSTKLRLE